MTMNSLPGGTAKTKPHSLRYNDGKIVWSMVDFKALEPMVRVLMYGAHKYSTYRDRATGATVLGKDIPGGPDPSKYDTITSGVDNWKIGFEITALIDSMQRHIVQMLSGEANDVESGQSHIGHILCNAMFISHYQLKESSPIEFTGHKTTHQ